MKQDEVKQTAISETVVINLYVLESSQFIKVFPKLLEGIVGKGNRIVIFCDHQKSVEALDRLLWTYQQLSFLPHATYQDDGIKEDSPIYITTSHFDNQNRSNFFAFVSEVNIDGIHSGEISFDIIKTHSTKYEKYLYFCDDSSVQSVLERLNATPEITPNTTIIEYKDDRWVRRAMD
ncbi:DNA polymerase III subunit chi [Rickettsiales endosymbiont of Peranema trichophorum]|uniref:DNA polymerase III subunit chi n=1 Tax=Rickettsiales endosymbiont of Peranema trichophorum TaxID=2486577 RepID=UPI001022F451|nr:DNA polymerase III subunit chi [Rickettsiales endosymbiont of Peranema trichophorum]RZI45622.1 DNA polymerase III subunit chi [Rickettsiales endosymbiont of Peranema trichophorum]